MKKHELHIIYGKQPKRMIKELLCSVEVEKELDKSMSIGLKPNLVVAKSASSGATTSPEIVRGIIEYLKDCGLGNISIMESSWAGESTVRAFKACGYDEISKEYHVPLIDLKRDTTQTVRIKDFSLVLCSTPLQVDYLINLPVLKGHGQTGMTCALKNLKGCIPDSEKRRYHALGLHKPIAFLNKALRQDLIVVDGMRGDLSFEEGGTPVEMDRIIIGKDPVLVDSYVAELMGFRPAEIGYLNKAAVLGIGSMDLSGSEITEYGELYKKSGKFRPSGHIARLSKYITEKEACSACYGSLIHALKRLEERGKLGRLQEKIYIGQGYTGLELAGIGIGKCTRDFHKFVPGCPPRAKNIIEYLEKDH